MSSVMIRESMLKSSRQGVEFPMEINNKQGIPCRFLDTRTHILRISSSYISYIRAGPLVITSKSSRSNFVLSLFLILLYSILILLPSRAFRRISIHFKTIYLLLLFSYNLRSIPLTVFSFEPKSLYFYQHFLSSLSLDLGW